MRLSLKAVCTAMFARAYLAAANDCFSLYYPETVDILKKVNSKMYMYFRKVLQLACQGQAVAAAKVLVAITKCVLQSEQTFSLVRYRLKVLCLGFRTVFYANCWETNMNMKFEERIFMACYYIAHQPSLIYHTTRQSEIADSSSLWCTCDVITHLSP